MSINFIQERLRMAMSPRVGSYLIAAIVGAVVGVGYWFIINRVGASINTSEKPPSAPVVRVLYSSTQTVEISSAPGPYNETLNLDNIATMVQADEWNHDAIGMILQELPPLIVDKPKAGEGYKDEKGNSIVTNPDNNSSIHIANLTIIAGGTKYLFSRSSPIHFIQIGERRFRITLQSIRDKSNDKKKKRLIAYTFGISEQ
jgi:hypothetical protein